MTRETVSDRAPWGEIGHLQYDDDGNPIVETATCGYCGRSWNDALITSLTPVPSGRCPFEYEHEYPEDDESPEDEALTLAREILAHPQTISVVDGGERVYSLLASAQRLAAIVAENGGAR